jgi:hypothetical protein
VRERESLLFQVERSLVEQAVLCNGPLLEQWRELMPPKQERDSGINIPLDFIKIIFD